MSKRKVDNVSNSGTLLKYFPKVAKHSSTPQNEHPQKKNIPNHFYGKCLNDQFSQIESANSSINEELVSLNDESENFSDTENENCNNEKCLDEVR